MRVKLCRVLPSLRFVVCLLLIRELTSSNAVEAVSRKHTFHAHLESDWNSAEDVSQSDLKHMRDEVQRVFHETYGHYLKHAFPMDELLPISCEGSNTEGGIAVTLLDVLDTLIVMDKREEIMEAVELVRKHVNFDIDQLVNVFEVNIRVLGGLLSAHVLLKRNPDLIEDYNDSLLTAALDVGERLLLAFERSTHLPSGRINLLTGKVSDSDGEVPADIEETCSACAGTLLLEMGMLSRLTGQPVFEEKAKAAIKTLFNLRSDLGLIGGIVDIRRELWNVKVSSIGAGADSLYEYLLKAFILFGDEEYLSMFVDLYTAVMDHMQTPKLLGGYQWLADVHSHDGYFMGPWVSSLSSFWPGVQALADVWRKFAALPELFSIDGARRHPSQSGYPLRPELIESNFILYSSTQDSRLLQLGRMFQRSVLATNTYKCGYANIKDVATGELEDSMPSFFLSETLKYLFLLNSNVTSFIDAFVFTTEAHIFPPLPAQTHYDPFQQDSVPADCSNLCMDKNEESVERDLEEMRAHFPLLRVTREDLSLIRSRRCAACVRIALHRNEHPKPSKDENEQTMYINWAVPSLKKQAVLDKTEYTTPGQPIRTTTAKVMCSVEKDKVTGRFSCQDITSVDIAEDHTTALYLTGREVYVSLHRSRLEEQSGRLLLLYGTGSIEIHGHFLPQDQLKKDTSISQDCPAKVLAALTLSKDSSIGHYSKACDEYLIHGRLQLVFPVSGCGRLSNMHALQDAIAVMDDGCASLETEEHMADAGARGIILVRARNPPIQNADASRTTMIPIFTVSKSAGGKILKFLEQGYDAHAIIGRTDSASLMTCAPSHPPLKLPASQTTCPAAEVELKLPPKAQRILRTHFPDKSMQQMLSLLLGSLQVEQNLMQTLFEVEQQNTRLE